MKKKGRERKQVNERKLLRNYRKKRGSLVKSKERERRQRKEKLTT